MALTRKPIKGDKIRSEYSGEIFEVLGDASFGKNILSLKRADGQTDCVIWRTKDGLNPMHTIVESEKA